MYVLKFLLLSHHEKVNVREREGVRKRKRELGRTRTLDICPFDHAAAAAAAAAEAAAVVAAVRSGFVSLHLRLVPIVQASFLSVKNISGDNRFE